MSVCIFVAADQAGTSAATEEVETEVTEVNEGGDTSPQTLQQFWDKVSQDISKVTAEDFKTQALPLARIKKIMKLDEEVKMISAEAPVLFAKAAEIFIHELTLRAWSHTEDNKRRTLQRNDITMAISKSDQFDFLIDIVPRVEVKYTKPRVDPPRGQTSTDQAVQQQPATIQTTSQPQILVQPQIVQPTNTSTATSTNNVAVSQHPITLVHQLLGPSGDVQQLPIQLTQTQLNMIRLQVQNNPNQPLLIQTQQPSPQIIQVSSQAQHPGQPQQVYIAQTTTTTQEDS